MKAKLIISMICLSVSLLGQAQTKNFIDRNYIEVTGKAELEVIPNKIHLSIILNENNLKNKKSIEAVEKEMIEKLSSLEIDIDKSLFIIDIDSNLKKYLFKENQSISRKEFQLILNSAKTVGKVFLELGQLGIANISISKTDHTDIISLRDKVKVNAIKAAKNKAVQLANAIDQRIGRAIFIQEQSGNIQDLRYKNSYRNSNVIIRELDLKMEEPSIEFQKIKLTYSILARFELD